MKLSLPFAKAINSYLFVFDAIMKILSLVITTMLAAQVSAFAPSSSAGNHAMQTRTSSQTRQTTSLSMAATTSGPFDFLSGIFPKKDKAPDELVIIDSDYTLSFVFGAIGIFIILTSPDKSCLPGSVICPPTIWGAIQGGLNILFASFLAIQAQKIRFVFDSTAFELKNVDFGTTADDLIESGENFVVGGENRWRYDSFVNFDFFPSVEYPILVYFKENQTPEEKWGEGPGGLDKVGGGQVHFFPAIGNVKQLKEQFELRGCKKIRKE